MLGTAVYQVGRNSSTHWKNCAGKRPGVQIMLAPAVMDESKAPTRPWMWNRGMTFRHRSPSTSWRVDRMLWADLQRFVWVSGMIFGREVVPDVCSTSATSEASARPLCAGGEPAGPSTVNRPASA